MVDIVQLIAESLLGLAYNIIWKRIVYWN